MAFSDNLSKLFAKIIPKHSSFSNNEPTKPSSQNHLDGTWSTTDLYKGEMFLNTMDKKAWFRDESGFTQFVTVAKTGGTANFPTGTTVNVDSLSATTLSGGTIYSGSTDIGQLIQNTTVAGSDTEVQFNSGGTHGASSNFTFNGGVTGTVNNASATGDTFTVGRRSGTAGLGSVVLNGGLINSPPNFNNEASGDFSIAQGLATAASGRSSHAEGFGTTASGIQSHAEGSQTIASGLGSHAEGITDNTGAISGGFTNNSTKSSGRGSHAEGASTLASGKASHSEGTHTFAKGTYSHAEGFGTTGSANASHAEGTKTTASGDDSHAEGFYTTASGNQSHAGGLGASSQNVIASGKTSFVHFEADGNVTGIGARGDRTFLLGGINNDADVNATNSGVLGGSGNTVTGKRSVVLGGSNLTATTSDTVYVDKLDINSFYDLNPISTPTATKGRVYFDSGDSKIYVNTGGTSSDWVSMI